MALNLSFVLIMVLMVVSGQSAEFREKFSKKSDFVKMVKPLELLVKHM